MGVALPGFFPKLNLIFKLGFFCPSAPTPGVSGAPFATVLFSRLLFGVAVVLGKGVLPVPLGNGTLIFVPEELLVAECEPGVPSLSLGEPPPHDGESLAR